MKKHLLCIAAALVFVASPQSADGAVSVSVDLFYDALEPHGEWVDVDDYGYCWQPRDVAKDWRPYTAGHWVFTDVGWTWVSDEPYGWAVYHYGRWVQLESAGWVWVPDGEWGPAWVSWRRSDRHVGWAPLPPEAQFTRTKVIREWADSYYDIGPAYYSFVEVRNFGAPRLREVLVEPRQNITIINQTTNITNIRVENNVIYNGGPDYDVIVKESAQPIRRLKLERRTEIAEQRGATRDDAFAPRVEGESLRVITPQIRATPQAAQKKVARRIQQPRVNRGWQVAGDQTEVQRVRAKIKSEAKVPADLPPQPKFERTAARVTQGAPTGDAGVESGPAAAAAEKPVATTAKRNGKAEDRTAAGKRGQPETADDSSPTATVEPGRKPASRGAGDPQVQRGKQLEPERAAAKARRGEPTASAESTEPESSSGAPAPKPQAESGAEPIARKDRPAEAAPAGPASESVADPSAPAARPAVAPAIESEPSMQRTNRRGDRSREGDKISRPGAQRNPPRPPETTSEQSQSAPDAQSGGTDRRQRPMRSRASDQPSAMRPDAAPVRSPATGRGVREARPREQAAPPAPGKGAGAPGDVREPRKGRRPLDEAAAAASKEDR